MLKRGIVMFNTQSLRILKTFFFFRLYSKLDSLFQLTSTFLLLPVGLTSIYTPFRVGLTTLIP